MLSFSRSIVLQGVLVLGALTASIAPSSAVEIVTFKRDDREQAVSGRLIVADPKGNLLLQTPDGVLWTIPVEEQIKRNEDSAPFVPMKNAELAKRMLTVLPSGFETYSTQHYVICHDTSKAYAQWCGALFEQLYRAFTNYWDRRGFAIKTPEFPLVAVVFADKQSYAKFAQPELGEAGPNIIGYYSLQTNRMTMHDLTGLEALRGPGARRTTTSQINEMLAQPAAERTVATIVHEATHQIAFNCGLQTRFADIPLWVSEGVAVYFETPDLKSTTGWNSIGGVNHVRLALLRDYLARRPPGSLKTLLADDQRFRNARDALEAYAEAWALNYFLIRQRPKQYLEYFKRLAAKTAWVADGPDGRLREFQEVFGDDLQKLDQDFVRYMLQVR